MSAEHVEMGDPCHCAAPSVFMSVACAKLSHSSCDGSASITMGHGAGVGAREQQKQCATVKPVALQYIWMFALSAF